METKLLVVVLEDEPPLLEAIRKKLELNGFEVLGARSVEDGWAHLNSGRSVAAVWLDHYLLGQENGLDFVARLKQSEQWKHLPIFVVSNTASPEKVTSYMQLGVDKYYTKADYRLDQIIADLKAQISSHS